MKRITMKQINVRLFSKYGNGIKLVKGKDYFYFAGPLCWNWEEAGVYGGITRLKDMTLAQWISEAATKLEKYNPDMTCAPRPTTTKIIM